MKANLERTERCTGVGRSQLQSWSLYSPLVSVPAEWGVGIRIPQASGARASLPHILILVTTSTSKIPRNKFLMTDTNPREADFKILF